MQAGLLPEQPLRADDGYAAFLCHSTSSACSCVLCSPDSFQSLLAHLSHHKQRIRRELLQRLRTQSTLSYIPYACLSIDSSWTQWLHAVTNSLRDSLPWTTAEQAQAVRQRMERRIAHIVNSRREDGGATGSETAEEEAAPSFSPFCLTAQPEPEETEADVLSTSSSVSCAPPPPPPPAPPPPDVFSPFASFASAGDPYFVIPTLSVRSSLTLYLQHRCFPAGSSVLLTAITIPDMLTVLSHFHLEPIPVDVEPVTLSPSGPDILARCRPGTVALLVAHLYGKQMAMDAIIAAAQRLGLEVWEDIAEGFRGFCPAASPSSSRLSPYAAPLPLGDPRSDLVLFSFGAIKLNTALGGGLLLLPPRHHRLAAELLQLHHSLPVASSLQYLSKCGKAALAMGLLNVPLLSWLTMTTARAVGLDHKALVVHMLRGFPSGLMRSLQHQPSLPLLQQLHYRLDSYRHQHLLNTAKAELLTALLPASVLVPGRCSPSRHYWLFPIVVQGGDVQRCLAELNALGVDAYRGATQLAAVTGGGCTQAEQLMDSAVYLPLHARVPLTAIVRMAAIVDIVAERQQTEAGRRGEEAAGGAEVMERQQQLSSRL